MKEWPDVVFLMARASEAAKENPSSKQAIQFQDLMAKLQASLSENLASIPGFDKDEVGTQLGSNDSLTDDNLAGDRE